MNQPEDYPRRKWRDIHPSQFACPLCGSPVKGPTPAMMEDDDWRKVCLRCWHRSTYSDARVAWLRTHSAQRSMKRTITT